MTPLEEDQKKKKLKVDKRLEQTLLQDIHSAQRHVKGCSASLVIRKMQFKTTMRYHFTPVRMAIIKKSAYNKCW